MQIAEHCYAVTGLAYLPPWSVNAGIVAGRHTTLIVDTSACSLSAATIHGYATAMRPGNRLLVINTEKHFDHVGGNGYFRQRGVEILGHPGIVRTDAEFLAEKQEFNASIADTVRRQKCEESVFYTGTTIAPPTQFITAATTLDLGELEAQIILTPGHTPTNLSVYVSSEEVLFSGDCVVTGYLPNLDCGGPLDWRAWLDSLDKIQPVAPKVIVPGHGPVATGSDIDLHLARIRTFLHVALRTGVTPTGKRPTTP